MKTFTLNLAGNKVNFTIQAKRTYDNNGDFKVMTSEGNILISGYVFDNIFEWDIMEREVEFFKDVLLKKVKTELRKNNVKFR